jgi:hypothetical protein
MAEKFEHVQRKMNIQVHHGKESISFLNIKKSLLGDIIMTLPKVKNKQKM